MFYVDYKIKVKKFEGPLDLLLQLIEKNKLEITEVSLAEITDQYILYLDELDDLDPEQLSDFLVVATRLLLIKSKALLPYIEEDEELDDLENQLKIFKDFFEASKLIQKLIANKKYSYVRPKIITSKEIVFTPPEKMSDADLREFFVSVIKRVEPIVNIPQAVYKKTVSLQERLQTLRNLIDKQEKFSFTKLVKDSKSKNEVIVNFLALLELIKEKPLKIKQSKNFGEITVDSKI